MQALPPPSERHRQLYQIAERQGGYFTTKQAKALGYASNKRVYHVRAGNWIRERRGVYRLAHFPEPERPDLLIWWLWSRDRSDRPQGVFSHQSALSLHDLTDVMPAKIHMTVPKGFRRGTPIPEALRLHFGSLSQEEIETIDAVPVTNTLRTIFDVWQSRELATEVLRSAFVEALRRGKITRPQLDKAERNPAWRDAIRALKSPKAV